MRPTSQAPSHGKPLPKRNFFASLLIVGSIASLGLSGCSYLEPYKAPVTQGNVMTQESVDLLQEGLNQAQVRKLLGPPMGANAFNPYHWEYIFYTTDEASKVEVRKLLILNFDNNKYLKDWNIKAANVDMIDEETFFGL
ncbi:outer membrane protein assembly factor BamE [Thiomicrorhabdus sp. 6S2-11]|uniref:Outer membrane protein assembly factor BamE n=1 Tax=Thiomicrorhabdus marina TaxID=2818442 RepID=A0ABS3Q325_9GAMM|nr:outer membrane protein assembly factor BamE [Thiomicrorhabdus marina]MBO1926744.1 outer membrane protein assembly factor BamE [Thiomicrorhabdus marina]